MGYPPLPNFPPPPSLRPVSSPWMYSQALGRMRQRLATESGSTWGVVWMVALAVWWGVFSLSRFYFIVDMSLLTGPDQGVFWSFAVTVIIGCGIASIVIFVSYARYHDEYRKTHALLAG